MVLTFPVLSCDTRAGSKAELTTMMKSVGESMAMGRTWQVGVCV